MWLRTIKLEAAMHGTAEHHSGVCIVFYMQKSFYRIQ